MCQSVTNFLFDVRNVFLKVHLLHFEELGNTVLLHGHTVKHICFFHGASPVGDEHELCGIGEVFQVLCVLSYVYLVESCVYLIKDTERRRSEFEYRKVYCDSYE